jgi:hypothetical protein
MARHAMQTASKDRPHDLVVVVRPLAELKPNPNNARKHSAEQIAQIAELDSPLRLDQPDAD